METSKVWNIPVASLPSLLGDVYSCGAFRGEEKGENAVARRDTCMGASLDGSIAKARPAPKAVCSGRLVQGGR